MSKFSRGPWTYEYIKDKEVPDYLVIKDVDGKLVMELWDADEQDKINFKFIATAPRMLALIKKAIDIMDDIAQDCSWLDEGNALIAEIEEPK